MAAYASPGALKARLLSLMNEKRTVIAAIDGMAASGKTTLAESLRASIPGCCVVHMDDFTIPFADRYEGYFDARLSNADVNRFDREVLTPLLEGGGCVYRPYRCHPQPGFLPPVSVPSGVRCVIVEGAYCLNPQLFDRYHLRALMTVSDETQRRRILARNGQAQLERFLTQWIPMENRHIQAHGLSEKCDLILSADQDA